MTEEWKPIVGFEGLYEVSNFGEVRKCLRATPISRGRLSSRKERFCKIYPNSKGYPIVCLCKKCKRFYKTVHSLVWDAFGNITRQGMLRQIDHIDNNKNNARIDNLQLVSNRQNQLKRWASGGRKYQLPSGVTYNKGTGRYQSQISIKGKNYNLGQFGCPTIAHLAYYKIYQQIEGENSWRV